jgi:hypothetical protein
VDVRIDAEEVPRQPRQVEAALYFCCLEALQNAAKHAGAQHVDVRLERTGPERDLLRLLVHDDGAGFDPAVATRGAGLSNMRDRLDAVGGRVSVESRPGAGTTMDRDGRGGRPRARPQGVLTCGARGWPGPSFGLTVACVVAQTVVAGRTSGRS